MQARPNEQTRNSNLDLLAPDPIGLGGEIGTGKNWPISRRKKVCGNAIWGPFLKPPIFLSRQSFCARGEPHSPSGCGPCGSPNSWCEALKKNYSGTKLPPPLKSPYPRGGYQPPLSHTKKDEVVGCATLLCRVWFRQMTNAPAAPLEDPEPFSWQAQNLPSPIFGHSNAHPVCGFISGQLTEDPATPGNVGGGTEYVLGRWPAQKMR